MNTNNRSISLNGNPNNLYQPTQQLLGLGRRNGWDFHSLGYAEYPEKPVRLEKWMITPAHLDSSPIPKRTMVRIQTIYESGLRPRGFVVVHEAPMALSAPKKQPPVFGLPAPNSPKPAPPPPIQKIESSSPSFSDQLGEVAAIFGTLAMVVFPMLFLSILALDPIVVAVMEDGCWVEIDRWQQSPDVS